MERTITGTVEKVYDPTASNRPWNVVIGGKRCAAWAPKGSSGDRCPLAEVAKSYVGSNVEAKVDESQNGEYTNYKLLSIKLADDFAKEIGSTPISVTTADPKQGSIERQTAAKAAGAVYSGTGDDDGALALAQKWVDFFQGTKRTEPLPVAAAAETNDGPEW